MGLYELLFPDGILIAPQTRTSDFIQERFKTLVEPVEFSRASVANKNPAQLDKVVVTMNESELILGKGIRI